MKTLSRDTDPEVERIWIEGIRQMGPEASLDRCIRLSNMTRRAARDAIRRTHPEMPAHTQDLLFLQVQYGDEMSDEQLTEFIERRRERGYYDDL